MPTPDLVGIVEAAYRLDLDDAAWIRGVTEAAAPLLHDGLGVAGYCIDTTGARPTVHSPVFVGERDPWDGDWRAAWWEARVARMPPRLIADLAGFGSPAFASESCGAVVQGSMVARLARNVPPLPLPPGLREALVVSGYDAGGEGAVLFAFRRAPASDRLAPREAARWQRVSGHLTAAVRLRRLGCPRDARPCVPTSAVVQAIDRARTRRHRADDRALELWPALHGGRFSIVPSARRDGAYEAFENRPPAAVPGRLTPRESAAVTLLSLGRSNKAIGYELGVAASTVSTLLTSAARKLGVTGVRGLVDATRPTVHASGRARALGARADLTEAETVVLTLLLTGLSDAEVVAVRGSTRGTVTKQIDAVFRKLGVGSRRELLATASSFAPWSPTTADETKERP